MRSYNRKPDELRPVKFTRQFLEYAEGSVLVEFGKTKVIVSASIQDSVPGFLMDSGEGWVTAEYAMLPKSVRDRIPRGKSSGRTYEIQRLIGRSLRAVTDMKALGPRTLYIDCDVIQADGGTRTASITGAYVALVDAFRLMEKEGMLEKWPLKGEVAAISCGIYKGNPLLDLDYEEDSKAEVDLNVVMTGSGKFVEVQGTAESEPFDQFQLDDMLNLARKGIQELIEIQKKVLID